MANWIRIFGTNNWRPRASALVEHLLRAGFRIDSDVLGDDDDWEQVTLEDPGTEAPVMLERMPPDSAEVCDEVEPLLEALERMDDVVDVDQIEDVLRQTRQLFIVGIPSGLHSDETVERLSTTLSQFLAQQTKGIYQVDGEGFYDAKGMLLLEEH
jgi:hypothetical protein